MPGRPGFYSGLIIILVGLTLTTLRAQGPVVPATQSIGQEPYGAYAASATESVNFYDGNNNVGLGLFSLKGRNGQEVGLSLAYNTKQIVKKQTAPGQYQYVWNYNYKTQGLWVVNWPQITDASMYSCDGSNNYLIKPIKL